MVTSKPWVVNASPLILLGKLQQLDLLAMLAPSLVVPEAVIREVAAGSGLDRATAGSMAWARERMRPDVPVATSVSINASTIKNIETNLPKPSEQTAIAATLSDVDAELAALEARRDKTHAFKQGMMQELLTGRIRLT